MTKADDKLHEMKAEILAAVGHPIRLRVVEMLADGEMCVCDIAERLGAERSNVSRHLGVLTRAGLLSARKEGLRVLYRLEAPCVLNITKCVEQILRRRARHAGEILANL